MRAVLLTGTLICLLVARSDMAAAQSLGSISGRITFAGDPPAQTKFPVKGDKHVCGSGDVFDESAIVGPDKGLKNAVVTVLGAKSTGVASQKIELEAKGCAYVPRVVVVPTTGHLDVLNRDGIPPFSSDPQLHCR